MYNARGLVFDTQQFCSFDGGSISDIFCKELKTTHIAQAT